MSALIPFEGSFSLTAYVESPGWARVIPKGYVYEKRAGQVYVAPLIPQLFYGVDGTQLRTWRQYIPRTGSVVILRRVAGEPQVPRERLYWVKLKPEEAKELGLNPDIGHFMLGLAVGAFFLGAFIWTPLGREFTIEAIRRGSGLTRARLEEWLRKGEEAE